MDGFWKRLKGRTKSTVGTATGRPDVAREGAREERVGEIDSRRESLDREEARLRSQQVREKGEDI